MELGAENGEGACFVSAAGAAGCVKALKLDAGAAGAAGFEKALKLGAADVGAEGFPPKVIPELGGTVVAELEVAMV